MKEAVITDVNGFYTGITLVEDTVTGVLPINQITPSVLDKNGVVITPEKTALIGYQVAVHVPEGLHLPKFDFTNSVWIEGKTAAQLAVKPVRVPTTDERIASLEAALLAQMGL